MTDDGNFWLEITTLDEDFFQWFGLGFMWISAIVWGYFMAKRQTRLEEEWKIFLQMRKELYERLADPDRIEKELEKSAQRREMYDAKRTTLPRENAGPPAVVYRPLLRGVKPGTWRPRNPGSPSKK